MQKMKITVLAFIMVVLGFATADSWAEGPCPEIDGSLRFELYKTYQEFEIASLDFLTRDEQQVLAQHLKGMCSYAVELTPSVIVVVLKKKQGRDFQVVLSESSIVGSKQKWELQQLGIFSGDIPLLSKPKSGFYSDIVTGKSLAVTRESKAVQVMLPESGQEFIYKIGARGEVEQCQVK
jgi:hypothetical protein